jgi:thiamine biosynthesis lipoprotein
MIHFPILLFSLFASLPSDGARYLMKNAGGPGHETSQLSLISFDGKAQGTTYHIKYYDPENRSFKAEVDSILADFDRSLSLYRVDSEISEFNRNETFTFQSPYFYPVLKKSQEIYEDTDGAFDPTVMPLMEALGFGAKKVKDPGSANIDSLLQLVGFRHIRFDTVSVQKTRSHIRLDFNGIAQGYSVDVISEFLSKRNITRYMVEIGGEVRTKGTKDGGKPWVAGIEDPLRRGALIATVALKDRAMTTAGNYHNHFTSNGQVFNHLINPKTGSMEQTSLLSVTVFARDAMTADGYDTAFFVMGTEAVKDFTTKRRDLDVFLIYTNQNGVVETFASDGIRDLIKEIKQ